MSQPDFIDLCDSSDDEKAAKNPAWQGDRGASVLKRPDPIRDPLEVDDPFDLALDCDLLLPPPKRQKRDAVRSPSSSRQATPLKTTVIRSIAAVSGSRIPASISPHPPIRRLSSVARTNESSVELLVSSDPILDESDGSSSPRKDAAIDFSATTASLLADITNSAPSHSTVRKGPHTAKTAKRKSRDGEDHGTNAESAQTRQGEKERRRAERLAAQELKKAEKEATKERKRAEKERKDAEKQKATELAGANKARGDKTASAAAMIVDLPSSIEGKPLETELREELETLGIESTVCTSILPNIVRFRRRVTTAYNEELGHPEPVPEHIQEEKQIMCLISGQSLLTMAVAPDSQREGVGSYLELVRLKYPDYKITCLVDGLDAAIKKGAKATRKAYNASVRGENAPRDTAEGANLQAPRHTQSHSANFCLEDQLGEALVALQVEHGCLVHQTDSAKETASFIVKFTQYMSTIPDR